MLPQDQDLFSALAGVPPSSEEEFSEWFSTPALQLPDDAGGRYEVRTHLFELQSAESGRKFVTVDRRSLDPPPAVSYQVFDVYDAGTPDERQLLRQPDEQSNMGLICCAELMAFESSEAAGSSGEWKDADDQTGMSTSVWPTGTDGAPSSDLMNSAEQIEEKFPFDPFDFSSSTPIAWPSNKQEGPVEGDKTQGATEGTFRSRANVADLLFGNLAVEPCIIDWLGARHTMFVFGDLAVREQGMFYLNYRVFDIARLSDTPDGAAMAMCSGKPFEIYSTKHFPGLGPSSDLTKVRFKSVAIFPGYGACSF